MATGETSSYTINPHDIPADVLEKATAELQQLKAADATLLEPVRSHIDDVEETTQWRYGKKPDYTLANLAFLKGKTQSHAADSLERIVENLVKTWEMEGSHKPNFRQWKSVNHDHYSTQANGGKVFQQEESSNIGNYNWLFESCRKDLYDYQQETFDSSHAKFRSAFPNGFPWELLAVYSGPPQVAFTWRHWANFDGSYKENKGKGQLIEMVGCCVATVNAELKIESLQIFYQPEEFLEKLEGIRETEISQEEQDQVKEQLSKASISPPKNGQGKCPFSS